MCSFGNVTSRTDPITYGKHSVTQLYSLFIYWYHPVGWKRIFGNTREVPIVISAGNKWISPIMDIRMPILSLWLSHFTGNTSLFNEVRVLTNTCTWHFSVHAIQLCMFAILSRHCEPAAFTIMSQDCCIAHERGRSSSSTMFHAPSSIYTRWLSTVRVHLPIASLVTVLCGFM